MKIFQSRFKTLICKLNIHFWGYTDEYKRQVRVCRHCERKDQLVDMVAGFGGADAIWECVKKSTV